MTNKKGFTLLELLIVVIIIGILAAIALPQYKLAVDKANYSKCRTMVSSLRNAYNEYFMVNGQATYDFSDLSITLPQGFEVIYDSHTIDTCMSNGDIVCCLRKPGGYDYYKGHIACLSSNLKIGYVEELLDYQNNPINNQYCVGKYLNKGKKLCESLGKEFILVRTLRPNGDFISYQWYK